MMIASSAYETNPSLIQDYVTQIDRLLEHAASAGEQESLMHALRKSLAKVEKRVEKPLKGLTEVKSQVELHAQAAATKAARAADAKEALANAYTKAAEAKAKAPQKAAQHGQQQHRMLEEDEHIDLLAFSTLIRTREGVDVEDDVIKKIFAAFDADQSGTISVHECNARAASNFQTALAVGTRAPSATRALLLHLQPPSCSTSFILSCA